MPVRFGKIQLSASPAARNGREAAVQICYDRVLEQNHRCGLT
jgi:hypothetical protein